MIHPRLAPPNRSLPRQAPKALWTCRKCPEVDPPTPTPGQGLLPPITSSRALRLKKGSELPPAATNQLPRRPTPPPPPERLLAFTLERMQVGHTPALRTGAGSPVQGRDGGNDPKVAAPESKLPRLQHECPAAASAARPGTPAGGPCAPRASPASTGRRPAGSRVSRRPQCGPGTAARAPPFPARALLRAAEGPPHAAPAQSAAPARGPQLLPAPAHAGEPQLTDIPVVVVLLLRIHF